MTTPHQPDFFEDANFEVFGRWKETTGGAQVLRRCYQEAAEFGERYRRTGQQVSMDYIFHRVRDRLAAIQLRLRRSGCTLPRVGGYRLNNNFTAYIARHIMDRRPDWDGMFELRKIKS